MNRLGFMTAKEWKEVEDTNEHALALLDDLPDEQEDKAETKPLIDTIDTEPMPLYQEKHPIDYAFFKSHDIWTIRLTPNNKQELTKFQLSTLFQSSPILVISEEGGKNDSLHFHLLLGCKPSDKITHDKIVEQLKTLWPGMKGNKHFCVKLATRPKQYLKYCLKEGDYTVKGLHRDFIRDMFILSRAKENMESDFKNIEDMVSLRQISMSKFVTKYIELKVKYGQNINNHQLISYFRRISMQTGHMSVEKFSQHIFDQL